MEAWGKDRLAEWKNFWESEMGKEAIKRMVEIREHYLDLAMQQTDPNNTNFCVGRAGGVDLVLQDIQAGIASLDKYKEKEGKGGK